MFQSKLMKCVPFITVGLLAACGGGGGGGSTASTTNPGNSQTGSPAPTRSTGPVQEFGSVVVNGVRFDTSSASFSVDGQPGSQSQLFVGQKVTVDGSVDADGLQGVANSVIFEAELEGRIDTIDRANNQFVVLGQTVLISGTTTFQNSSFATLAVNDRVEVSGEFDANGFLRAYAIERGTSSGSSSNGRSDEVKGTIAALNNASQRFNLNSLAVDYSAAILEPSNAILANGQFVEVEGSVNGSGVLIATRVEQESRNDFDDDDRDEEAEITGFVESVLSSTRFIAAGITIEHGPGTRFEDGTAANIQANVRIEAEGFINANGVLIADEIEFEDRAERDLAIKIEGRLQSRDANAGQVRLLNVTVNTSNNTLIRDERSNQQPFGLANLQVGDFVEIRAFVEANGRLVAGRIERDDDEGRVILQTVLEGKDSAAQTLLLAGVTVNTGGARYETDDDDRALTQQQFYAQAQVGDLIKVKGAFDGSVINAIEVSFEQEDDETDDDDDDLDDRDDD